MLLYGARAATKDVGVVVAHREVMRAAQQVAARFGLPEDWLNDGAKGYLHGLSLGDVVFRSTSLIVRAPAVHQLLAMKLAAWRDDVDIDDARLLLSKMDGDLEQVWHLVEAHLVPGRELKARYAFEDLWDAVHGHP